MITTSRLTKRFRGTAAVDGLDLSIHARTITAVLGPNGSGKTTLLRMLAGHLAPTSGTVAIDGVDVGTDERIPWFAVAHDGLNAGDGSIRDALRIARTRPGWDEAEYRRLAQRFEIPNRREQSKLSSGQQASFAIATAIASGAPVLIIDEAHASLDAIKRLALFEELIRVNAEQGRTVIIASHHISELESLVEQVIVVDHGRLIAMSDVDTLRERFVRVLGKPEAVAGATDGRLVMRQRELGSLSEAVVDVADGPLPQRDGLEVAPLDLQAAFVALVDRALQELEHAS